MKKLNKKTKLTVRYTLVSNGLPCQLQLLHLLRLATGISSHLTILVTFSSTFFGTFRCFFGFTTRGTRSFVELKLEDFTALFFKWDFLGFFFKVFTLARVWPTVDLSSILFESFFTGDNRLMLFFIPFPLFSVDVTFLGFFIPLGDLCDILRLCWMTSSIVSSIDDSLAMIRGAQIFGFFNEDSALLGLSDLRFVAFFLVPVVSLTSSG